MQLEFLNFDYSCQYHTSQRYLAIRPLSLPDGFSPDKTPLLIRWNEYYPLTTPGYGSSKIYVDNDLQYCSQPISGVHADAFTAYGRTWAWYTPEHLAWRPLSDNLSRLPEAIRASIESAVSSD
jgi:hypothetical protein